MVSLLSLEGTKEDGEDTALRALSESKKPVKKYSLLFKGESLSRSTCLSGSLSQTDPPPKEVSFPYNTSKDNSVLGDELLFGEIKEASFSPQKLHSGRQSQLSLKIDSYLIY